MNILCIGDIVGKPGRHAVQGMLEDLRQEFSLDFIVANAENAAGGAGLTPRLARGLLQAGCDVLTMGDHVWDQKDLEDFLNDNDAIIRPANFPPDVPGRGWCVKTSRTGQKVAVVNLMGRVFMRYHLSCPFQELSRILPEVKAQTPVVIVDLHAEATSEKIAMGHFANGAVSVVFGTHTHIQTADEKILSRKTAYITDLGMTGPYDSVIGQTKEDILERFLKCMPVKFQIARGDIRLCGIVVGVDPETGEAEKILRIQREFEDPFAETDKDEVA